MRTSNYSFLSQYIGTKNYLNSKPVKGLRGYDAVYDFGFQRQEVDDEFWCGSQLSVDSVFNFPTIRRLQGYCECTTYLK